MTFACPRCGYESDTRFNMRRHLTRTRACTLTVRLGANLDDEGIITRAFALTLDDRFTSV